jgi:putative intracellular protease/amidase
MRSIRWLCWLLLPTFAWAQANPRDVTVAILMFDGVQIIDYAAPYEVFAQAGFTVYTVSKDGRPVKAAQGLKSDVDHSFATAPAARIVVVPGGSVHDAQRDAELIAWLRKQSASAEHVMSVCTGSFILGSAGLLDGHAATTFHAAFDEMQRQFPKTRILRDQRWVDAGKVVTSAGLAPASTLLCTWCRRCADSRRRGRWPCGSNTTGNPMTVSCAAGSPTGTCGCRRPCARRKTRKSPRSAHWVTCGAGRSCIEWNPTWTVRACSIISRSRPGRIPGSR